MTSDLPPPRPEERLVDEADPPTRGPNYTARRVTVGAAALALVAVAVVAVVALTRGGADGDSETDPARWNALIRVDGPDGDIVVIDPDGGEVATIDGIDSVVQVHALGDRVAFVGADEIVVASVGETGADRHVLELPDDAQVRRVPTDQALVLMLVIADAEVQLIDTASGELLPIGAAAGQASPMLISDTLRTDRNATRFAIGDGRNFQTITAAFGEDEAGFLPGLPVAVGDELTITSTVVGRAAELGFFDLDGTRQALVPVERPVGGSLHGDRFTFVTEDGTVMRASVGRDEAERLSTLDIGEVRAAVPVLDRSRLVVTGSDGRAVIDLDGDVLYATEVTSGSGDHAIFPWQTWRCLPVTDGETGVLVDLEDGSVLAGLGPGSVMRTGLDGCAVYLFDTAQSPPTNTITTGEHTVDLATGTTVTQFAPDSSVAVVSHRDGVDLVTVADGRRLTIGGRGGLYAFVER